MLRPASLVAVALLSSAALAQGSVFPSKAEKKAARLLTPESVSAESRAFLKNQMKTHAKEMRDLGVATATLKYDLVRKLAQGVAADPRLDPSVGPAAKLPPGFFALQDHLRKKAQAVADVAEKKDPDGLADAYSDLVVTCMACHWAFIPPTHQSLVPRALEAPAAEPGKAPEAPKGVDATKAPEPAKAPEPKQ